MYSVVAAISCSGQDLNLRGPLGLRGYSPALSASQPPLRGAPEIRTRFSPRSACGSHGDRNQLHSELVTGVEPVSAHYKCAALPLELYQRAASGNRTPITCLRNTHSAFELMRRACGGNRTHTSCLPSNRSTVELHKRSAGRIRTHAAVLNRDACRHNTSAECSQ